MRWNLLLAALATTLIAVQATAQTPDARGNRAAGLAFADRVCARCHVVSPRQTSPSRSNGAPSFEAIANAPTTTASGLHAFLSSPHPTMPNLILSRREQRDVIAYIMGLKRDTR